MSSGIRIILPLLMVVTLMFLAAPIFSGEINSLANQRAEMLGSIELDIERHGQALGCTRLSAAVHRALAKVPRHLFVPLEYRSRAYDNTPLPIGMGQTISQPTIVAIMTELMAPSATDTILEVGTGSGYQAAILAEVVAQVHTIEIVPELARSAQRALDDLAYENIAVHCGDGYAGLPDKAPFDAIVVTAAPPELPQALLDQLKTGGVLVAPVGPVNQTQWLTVWKKQADGSCHKRVLMPVRFVPMVGEGTE